MDIKENNLSREEKIIELLQTVYDPEFPFLDVYNLGLIYDILIQEDESIWIRMTLTSPACPAADMIVGNIKEVLGQEFETEIFVEVVFEPMWTIDMIKDPDLKRMFE